MEPAMVLCAGIAVASVTPAALRRVGWATTTVVTAVFVALVAMAAPSVAEPLPPIIRLAGVEGEPDDAAPPAVEIHEVVPGDSLWRIAATTIERRTAIRPSSSVVAGFWPHIYERNRPLIGDDPNLILPGQRLELPAS